MGYANVASPTFFMMRVDMLQLMYLSDRYAIVHPSELRGTYLVPPVLQMFLPWAARMRLWRHFIPRSTRFRSFPSHRVKAHRWNCSWSTEDFDRRLHLDFISQSLTCVCCGGRHCLVATLGYVQAAVEVADTQMRNKTASMSGSLRLSCVASFCAVLRKVLLSLNREHSILRRHPLNAIELWNPSKWYPLT